MRTFSDEELRTMKSEFISLIESITRKGMDKESLISKLNMSDFFEAPASTKYHNSIRGGLLDHSLNVYYNLKSLVERKGLSNQISEDSIKIVGLLSDISKMNFYKISYRNEKQYSDYGSKRDEGGRFDWASVKGYSVVDDSERFLYGNHEQTSEYMVRTFIPLTYAESVAILHHHGGTNVDSLKDNTPAIFARYPLAALLHTADMISTYVDESNDEPIY